MKKVKTLFKRDWENDPSRVTGTVEDGLDYIIRNEATPTRKLDGTCCMVNDKKLYKRHDRKRRGKKGKVLDKWKPEPEGWIPCQKDEKTGHWWGWTLVNLDAPENWMHKEAVMNELVRKTGLSFERIKSAVLVKYDLSSIPDNFKEIRLKGGMVEIDEIDKIDDKSREEFKKFLVDGKVIVRDGVLPIMKVPHFYIMTNIPLPDGTYELCGPKVNGNHEHLEKHVLLPHGKTELEFKFGDGDPLDELNEWFKGKDIEGIVWWKDDVPVAKIKKSDFGLVRMV
jgi:hypothetical protein